MSKTKGVCTECADGVTQTIAAGGLCYRHYRRKERLLNGNPDAEYDREQAWQVRLDKKEIKNVTAMLRLLKDSTDFLTAAEVNIINGVLHPHLQKITNSTTPTSVIGSSAACSPDSDVHRSPDEDEQGEQEDEVNSSLPACEHKEEIEQELPIGEQSEQENKVNSSPLSAPDTPIADAPVNCEPEKDVHSSLTPSQVLRHENHVANNFKTAGCPSCFPKEKPEPPAAQNETEAQERILAVLQPSAPYCGYIHYPEFSKYDLLKAAKFHPREEKDRAALVLDQLVSGGVITRTLDDTDDSISYVLTHTPPPDEDDEDEGEPEAPEPPPAENVAEEPAPADPAPKPPAPEPAEEPTQESCNPRRALPCETCTCISQPDLKPDEVCGAAAVVTCDCGSWCTNGLCISVCEEALGWYSGLDEDPLPEPELAADGQGGDPAPEEPAPAGEPEPGCTATNADDTPDWEKPDYDYLKRIKGAELRHANSIIAALRNEPSTRYELITENNARERPIPKFSKRLRTLELYDILQCNGDVLEVAPGFLQYEQAQKAEGMGAAMLRWLAADLKGEVALPDDVAARLIADATAKLGINLAKVNYKVNGDLILAEVKAQHKRDVEVAKKPAAEEPQLPAVAEPVNETPEPAKPAAPEPPTDSQGGDPAPESQPAVPAPKPAAVTPKRARHNWYLDPQTPMEHVRRSFWNRHEGIDGVDWKRAKRILRALRRSGFTNQELVDYLRGELTYQQVFSITKVLQDCGVTTVFCKPGTVAPTRNQIWVLKGEPGDPEYKAPVKAKAVA